MPEQPRALSHERVSKRIEWVRLATVAELLRRCRLLLHDTS